jgi:hypothetical protein
MPKGSEQEEWRDACWRCECLLQEGLRPAQAESEGHRQAVGADSAAEGAGAGAGRARRWAQGGRRGAGAEAGAGRRAALDAAVVPERARGIGKGRINKRADKPAWVSVRHSER